MQIVDMYSGDDGRSHMRDLTPEEFAKMADRIVGPVSVPVPYSTANRPSGYFMDWRPERGPGPGLVLVMCSGISEYETSDGWRRLVPGDVLIARDFTGQGHRFHVAGPESRFALVAKLTPA